MVKYINLIADHHSDHLHVMLILLHGSSSLQAMEIYLRRERYSSVVLMEEQ